MSKLTTYLQSELTDCTAGSPAVKLVYSTASSAIDGAGASPASIGKMRMRAAHLKKRGNRTKKREQSDESIKKKIKIGNELKDDE